MSDKSHPSARQSALKAGQTKEPLPRAISRSSLLWGGIVTAAFYAAIPHVPYGQATLQRYFCSHPLEYALLGLFFVGLTILTQRILQLRREKQALATGILPEVLWVGDDSANLSALEKHFAEAPRRLQRTVLMRRLRDAGRYLRSSQSARGLESHLKHLSVTAADRLHDSYSLLLTINWAVPILGFLGTVIGITLAIANVTPEQLDTSLNSVTGGLAVAFDTTTVAMSFSLVLVFAYAWIKRADQRILSTVDDVALLELLPIFARPGDDSDPLQEAQAEAARTLIDRTESLVVEQTEFWRDSVDGLRERWSETILDQQKRLSESLDSQVAATMDDHSSQLQQTRQEFLTAFEQVTEQFATALEADRRSREELDSSSRQKFEQNWRRVSDDLQAVVRSHDAHTEDVVDGLVERIQSWQSDLERSTQSVDAQLERLQTLTDTLLRLADQQQQLASVERQLSENLESVRAAETFEQTLHNLTAAVHLLTARANSKAA